jgi:alcohol dehydrogenase class IV
MLQSAGRIVFGAGSLARAGELLRQLGAARVLLVTDPPLAAPAEALRASAAAAGVGCLVFSDGAAEPPAALAEELARRVAGERFDAVVGLGGGSNIDLAKAAALLLRHGGSARDYAGQCRVPGPVLPVVAVPATAGSGSEVSGACILSLPEQDNKLAIVDHQLRPALALVDPEIQRTCPPGVTRDAGLDALCHAIEAFTIADAADFPRDPAVPWPLYQGKHPLTDVLAERAIGLLGDHLPRVLAQPHDLEARSQMALGALFAGIAMSNTGLYTVHALTYPVGAFTGASHGACNAALLPAVLDFVEPARPGESKRICELLRSRHARPGDAVRELLARVGAASTLAELGLPADKLEATAEIGFGIRRLMDGSPRSTSRADLLGIVRRAWGEA